MLCLVAQSCSTLCHPTDCSPPGSSVHGILQAKILEQVAMTSLVWNTIKPQFKKWMRCICRYWNIVERKKIELQNDKYSMMPFMVNNNTQNTAICFLQVCRYACRSIEDAWRFQTGFTTLVTSEDKAVVNLNLYTVLSLHKANVFVYYLRNWKVILWALNSLLGPNAVFPLWHTLLYYHCVN